MKYPHNPVWGFPFLYSFHLTKKIQVIIVQIYFMWYMDKINIIFYYLLFEDFVSPAF